jgi:pilus assembly protein CpaE
MTDMTAKSEGYGQMTNQKSVLIISPDPELSAWLSGSVDKKAGVRIDTETATLSGLNGRAVEMAKGYDVVLFQTGDDSAADLEALKAIRNGKVGAALVALADSSMSFAEAHAMMQAGVTEIMPLVPADEGAIGSKVARWLRTEAEEAARATRAGRVIAVAQARGGVGSTTVAVNLADQLAGGAKRSKRTTPPKVALVDFDLQFGTIGSFLDVGDQDALLQLAMDGTIPDATFLDQSMTRMANGLDVLAAPAKFAPIDSLTPQQVMAILDTLRKSHDYVIVDLPRALVGWVEPIVDRADELIIVTDISVSSVRHGRRLAEFFSANNVSLKVEFVVNRQRRPMFLTRMQKEASKALGHPLETWLPDDKAALMAADHGKPLSQLKPRSPLGKALTRFAAKTAARFPAQQMQPGK